MILSLVIISYVEIFCMLLEVGPLKITLKLSPLFYWLRCLEHGLELWLYHFSLSSSSHFICKMVAGKAVDSPEVRKDVQPEMSLPNKIAHIHFRMTQVLIRLTIQTSTP